MLAGLEELVLQCREETSKTHIQEAIRCYEAGAYRASIISTYIAVCFDLIAKLKVLASAGDGAATQLLQDLNGLQEQLDNGNLQAVAGLLLFERGLLEQFRDKFEFFGAHEYDDLARLRDDRNRCAHPTFLRSEAPYTPSAELARLHLRNALTLVLSQEPRQGKAALAELHLAVLSKYFPEDVPGAVTRLNTTALENAREALVRGFVDALVFGLATKENPYYRKIAAIVALEATIEMNRQIALPRAINGVHKLLRANNDISIEIASILAMRIPEIAESLDPPAAQQSADGSAKLNTLISLAPFDGRSPSHGSGRLR